MAVCVSIVQHVLGLVYGELLGLGAGCWRCTLLTHAQQMHEEAKDGIWSIPGPPFSHTDG